MMPFWNVGTLTLPWAGPMSYGLMHTFTPGNFLVVPGYSLFSTPPLSDSSLVTGSSYELSISPGMTVTLAGGNWSNGTPSSSSGQSSTLTASGQQTPGGNSGGGTSGNATASAAANGNTGPAPDTKPMDQEEPGDDEKEVTDSERGGLANDPAFRPRDGEPVDPAAQLTGSRIDLSSARPEIVAELIDQLNGTPGSPSDFRNHPDFVEDPTHPNGGYVAAVPRYLGGKVVGSMGTAGESKVDPPSEEALDAVQLALDVVGLVPGLGEFADAASGSISAARGDKVGAALSALSLAPVGGQLPGVTKITRRFKMLFGHADEAAAAAKAVSGATDAGSSAGRVASKLDDALDKANKARSSMDDGVAEAMERLDNGAGNPAEAMRKADIDDAARATNDAAGTAPRVGQRRISDELYEELRAATPTQEIRDMVNAGKVPPFPDGALPGLTVTKRLHADHMVSMDTITRMEGFDKLTRAQMETVLNNPKNFVGLSETANTSKGAKSFADWTKYKKGGIDVDSAFRQRMMDEEAKVARLLQQQIDDFLKK